MISASSSAQRRQRQTAELCERLQLQHPIIQAPMAGVSTPELAAAVASAGALGSLGMGGGDPTVIQQTLTTLTSLTNQPVNLNFFVHSTPRKDPAKEAAWLNRLEPLFTELGAATPAELKAPYDSFDANPATLDALLQNKAPVVSFHFGLPKPATMQALENQGTTILASATSVAEAEYLVAGGAHMVIAQGWEAGGHRGRFLDETSQHDEQLGTLSLVPQICAAVDVPVVAAGGIGNGAAAAAAMLLGAAAVQIGTAFITCPESSANSAYCNALQNRNLQTLMTPAFSGREARGLANQFTELMHKHATSAPDYPITYDAGKQIAAAAQATGDEQLIQSVSAMWAGQAFKGNRTLPASELVALIAEELTAALPAEI